MNPRLHYRQVLLLQHNAIFTHYAKVGLALTSESRSHYRRYLGEQYQSIYFAAQDALHADALLAVAGTLSGGGVLIIHAPESGSAAWRRLCRYLAAANITTTPVTTAEVLSTLAQLPSPNLKRLPLEPTAEQQWALQELHAITNDQVAVMINAPRGRGKSTLLGLWIESSSASEFIVCAPSKRQAAQVLANTEKSVHFVPPDQLTNLPVPPNTWLVIDEAASIPNHLLLRLMAYWPRIALATTTEGYESAGRGFLLRIQRKLPQYFSTVIELSLQQPVRWRAGDPLEQALNTCFCLQPHLASTEAQAQPPAAKAEAYHFHYCHASTLSDAAVSELFELLMAAHYQTSPNDLRLLLDDEQHYVHLQYYQQQLIGVCWVAYEGPLATDLATAIWQGKRRPAGNLLPQTMLYHGRHRRAGEFAMLRIVRIAVAPLWQGRGAGQQLLQQVTSNSPRPLDMVGTSFGGNAQLHRFWQQAGFQPVRLASHTDAASGLRSLVYMRPITAAAAAECAHYTQLFAATLPGYSNVPTELPWLQQWYESYQQQLSAQQQKQQWQLLLNTWHSALADFQASYITFSSLLPMMLAVLNSAYKYPYHQQLEHSLLAEITSSDLAAHAKRLGYTGKSALQQALREAATEFLVQLNV